MPHPSDDTRIWALLLVLAGLRRQGGLPDASLGIWLSAEGRLETGDQDDPRAQLIHRDDGFIPGSRLPLQSRDLVELYAPLLGATAERPVVVGHLGQSLDARIATQSGDSRHVTGPENLVHLHRMRALCDAVVVGAGTVAADNPRLTTRLVDGPNPVRVVIDPRRRLLAEQRLFTDGEAPTLILCAATRLIADDRDDRLVGIPTDADGLSLEHALSALRERGLHALFIEGGGVTVSRWMTAGKLDRLQIATAPLLIGSGRPGISLPPAPSMNACLRPLYRLYRMGEDLLWDFDLRGERGVPTARDTPLQPLLRLL